jgi:hypothetical protein
MISDEDIDKSDIRVFKLCVIDSRIELAELVGAAARDDKQKIRKKQLPSSSSRSSTALNEQAAWLPFRLFDFSFLPLTVLSNYNDGEDKKSYIKTPRYLARSCSTANPLEIPPTPHPTFIRQPSKSQVFSTQKPKTMSAEARPIPPAAFAEAIKELPLSSLYAKVSELRNSISHLTRSNEELRTYIIESEEGPDSPDNKDLEAYILENEAVMQSMAERIRLLKTEVEARGQRWMEEGEEDGEQGEEIDNIRSSPLVNGTVSSDEADGQEERRVNGISVPSRPRNSDQDERTDDGVYL